MIGVTIATDSRYYNMALEAVRSVNKHGNIPTIILTKGIHKEWWLWKSDLFELFSNQTIFYFDADTIMLQYKDLTKFDDQEEFIAVPDMYIEGHQDLGRYNLNHEEYFNTGMMIFNQRHRSIATWITDRLTNDPIQSGFYDQTYWNLAVKELQIPTKFLSHAWNWLRYYSRHPHKDLIIGHYCNGTGGRRKGRDKERTFRCIYDNN